MLAVALPFQLPGAPNGVKVLPANELGFVIEPALENEPAPAMLEGSDGLCCGAAASELASAESFLPKLNQLLGGLDLQPDMPNDTASRTAKRAGVNRIARAPCASLGKRSAARRDIHVALAHVPFPENGLECLNYPALVGIDEEIRT